MEYLRDLSAGLIQFSSGNPSTLLCLLATFIYILFFMKKRPKNFPPGPIDLPIVGSALFVGGRPEKTFASWRKKYGDLIGLKIGNEYTVVLNNYELIQEALVKNSMVFNHRPNNFIMSDVMHKSGITMSDYTGNYIKERKFASTSLSKLGFGKNSMETAIIEEGRRFVEYLSTTDGQWTDVNKRTLMNATANVICKVTLGKSYVYQDPEFMELSQGFLNFFRKGAMAYQMTLLLPWSRHFPPVRGSANAIREGFATVDRIMDEKIDEHEATLDPTNIRDFLDEYLIQMKVHEKEKSGIFSSTHSTMIESKCPILYVAIANILHFLGKMLKCMGRDLFGAAMESIQITILYLTIALANRPHIQQKIHEEIDRVLGSEGIPKFAFREEMPYCMAAIKETFRWRTVGPLTIAHCAAKDTVFRGYNIPKGTTILPNLYAVHNDPDLWENPSEFIPERHLDENGKLNISKYLIPFGIGPRSCIGRRVAEVEMFVMPVSILQKYRCIPTPTADCERPWVKEDVEHTGLVLGLPEHIAVTLAPRQ